MKIVIVLNSGAGTLKGLDAEKVGEEIAQVFRDGGHEVSVEVAEGKAAVEKIAAVCRRKSVDALVVGGGDGTVSAAAAECAKSGMTLGVLPMGTMNFFARSLGVPLDIKLAPKALATAEVAAVDIADVNGQPFVHVVALGLHPALVREREKGDYGSRYAKMLGSARAFIRVIRNLRRFSVSIATDDRKVARLTAGVVVSNNALGAGHIPYADRLDEGILGVYVTTAWWWPDLVRVTAAAATGKTQESPLIEHVATTGATIAMRRRRTVEATVDGELMRFSGPLEITIQPGKLKVLKPLPPEDEAPPAS